MTFILSMIAGPMLNGEATEIPQAILSEVEQLTGSKPKPLSRAKAIDFELESADTTLLARVRALVDGQPIDVNLLSAEHRRKLLLIADMDSTIIEQECIDEIADFAGLKDTISGITERAMRGELDFDAALRERVALLKGLPEHVLQETFDTKISLTPGAKTLVATMNKSNGVTALVSGGFTFFTTRVGRAVGFQETQANELIVRDGALTGEVRDPILGRAAKQNALLRLAGANDVALEKTIAVGDGANDLAMLERAGLGVAFHAKPAVAEAADVRIDHGDLTALLYLQGIGEHEFARD